MRPLTQPVAPRINNLGLIGFSGNVFSSVSLGRCVGKAVRQQQQQQRVETLATVSHTSERYKDVFKKETTK